jgi:sulfotransferase family protein
MFRNRIDRLRQNWFSKNTSDPRNPPIARTASMSPNLFVLGAGKCGTTSLHHILSQFPDVQVTTPKEPSFFCSYFNVVSNPIEYFNLFDQSYTWRCDCSHVYFSNPETAPVISSLFPEARFILIFRDPAQRAYSLYNFMRRHVHADGQPLEQATTFLEALRDEEHRIRDPEFFDNCRQYYWNFLYTESSRYDIQLKRYMDLYDRDRFHFLSLAELSHEPEKSIRKIAAFLQMDFPRKLSLEAKNVAPSHPPICTETASILEERLKGVTSRTDAMTGVDLDWSL